MQGEGVSRAILFNLCGHGHFDMQAYTDYLAGNGSPEISLRFYGRADQWRAIFEANRSLLDAPDRLTPGMTLVIP
jgi:hypothetical protein